MRFAPSRREVHRVGARAAVDDVVAVLAGAARGHVEGVVAVQSDMSSFPARPLIESSPPNH
jgi:hypothetical protein